MADSVSARSARRSRFIRVGTLGQVIAVTAFSRASMTDASWLHERCDLSAQMFGLIQSVAYAPQRQEAHRQEH